MGMTTNEMIFDLLHPTEKWDDKGKFKFKYEGISTTNGEGIFIRTESTANDCSSMADDLTKGISKETTGVQAIDPNDKSGPSGYDPEGTSDDERDRHIAGDHPLGYMVSFENLESATAATQEILISDQLDTNLDWSTFALDTIQIGTHTISVPEDSTSYTTEVDLRPELNTIVEVDCSFDSQTGMIEWYFKGKDPDTGEWADILPPNTEDIDPRGRGWVSYSVKPKANLPTGTVIKNKATIDFEVDIPPEPMDTPEVFNTLDNSKPTSQVAPLPATQTSTSFTVSWSGSDEGSGVRDYTIYVSDNLGPFTAWLTQTTDTSATFTGSNGHTYSFYSVARDNVGNQEDLPTLPDATTSIAGAECSDWQDVITKYQAYVNDQAFWEDVIACYQAYAL